MAGFRWNIIGGEGLILGGGVFEEDGAREEEDLCDRVLILGIKL